MESGNFVYPQLKPVIKINCFTKRAGSRVPGKETSLKQLKNAAGI
jgi:hypothetical protein